MLQQGGRVLKGMSMKKMLLAIIFAGVALSTAAFADTYVCKIIQDSKGNWIPENLAINYNTQTGDVIVNDEYIMHFHGKPIAGKVVTDNAKRITFTWTIPSVRNSAGQTALRFQYRASFLKRSGKMIVTSRPSGYENNFRGAGNCKVQ